MNKKFNKVTLVLLIALLSLLPFSGCKDQDTEKESVVLLRVQLAPLEIMDIEGNMKQITLSQVEHWHETHEHEIPETEPASGNHASSHHQCLGVLTGYRAIQFATQRLFGNEIPQADDFEMSVTGPMDGVWDVMGLYLDKDIQFDGQPKPLTIESFTFTGKRKSAEQVIIFRLDEGLIPEVFFNLKNNGATCGDPEMGVIKQKALLNLLSTAPGDCFNIIGN